MKTDDEHLLMVTHEIGMAVVQMRFAGEAVTETSLAARLEVFRKIERNTVGKGIYRDAAELVRKGKKSFDLIIMGHLWGMDGGKIDVKDRRSSPKHFC